MKRDRPRLQAEVIAGAWQAIGEAIAALEERKKAIAVDQAAAVITTYSERASFLSMRGETYVSHNDVGYMAVKDGRLLFWAARLMEANEAA